MQLMKLVLASLACGFGLLAAAARGQTTGEVEAAPAEPATAITSERIEQVQQSAEAATELSDADKAQIAQFTQQALNDLTAEQSAIQQAKDIETEIAGLEQKRAELDKKLAQPPETIKIAADRTIADLETERVNTQTLINEREQDLKSPKIDQTARTAKRKTARTLTAELPTKLVDLNQKLSAPPPDGEVPLVTESRTVALAVEKQLTQARLNAAQKELSLYDAADALNLPALRRDSVTRELVAAQKKLEALNNEINRQRQAEAERRAREAEIAAINAEPLLKEILEESLEIARSEQERRSQHEEDEGLLKQAESRRDEIQKDFQEAQGLVEGTGLEKMGIWLRKEREELQQLQPLLDQLAERVDTIEEIEFEAYKREEQLDALTDIEAVADELTETAVQQGETDADGFREKAVQVLRAQRVNLEKLVEEYSDYSITLFDLDTVHQQLVGAAEEYAGFLDERILWVRSHVPLTLDVIRDEGEAVSRILSPSTWIAATKSLGWDAADHLTMYVGVIVLVLYLISRRHHHGRQLQEVAKRASGRVTTSLVPTIYCLVLTVWLAAAWPGLILFLAWRLHQSSISTPEMHVAAVNFARMAGVFFLLEFVRQSVRPFGLADAHFDWNAKTLRRVRRLLWSLILFGLPVALVIACLHLQDPGSRGDGVERLFFMGAMALLALFAHGMLSPSSGALRQLKALQSGGWFDRLDRLWYLLAVGIPLALAWFAFSGYYDTAVRLAVMVQRTVWIIIAAVYLNALLSRWLMLRHRRLRIEQARERLAAAREKAEAAPESGAPLPEVDTDSADLDTSNEQSHRLLTTLVTVTCAVALWLVWVDVLPALRFLDKWGWETVVQTVETVEDPESGTTSTRPSYEIQRITLVNVVEVLVIIFLTTTAARNLPGLLDMSILARLPIDRSTGYAITSLTRYTLVLVGVIFASRALGIGWSKVQWLAAALTFGLGFGLQEIFANFVSGLIILFEQPVRVGDVVTIDGVSGVVNRIRIRATTIVDWDRKEYIVPNREFITGRLLNWTLSDKMNRVVINVGVKYGTDASRVREIIMQVLEEHENVLADPPPLVTFESFGDSSLNFVVRAYLPNLDLRLHTIHDLHAAIHDSLGKHGIEIPFPQRDLNFRTAVRLDDPHGPPASSNGQQEQVPVEDVTPE